MVTSRSFRLKVLKRLDFGLVFEASQLGQTKPLKYWGYFCCSSDSNSPRFACCACENRSDADAPSQNRYCAMLKIRLNRAMIRRAADPASNEAAGGSCTGKNLRHHSAHGFDIFILTLLDILTQRTTIPSASRSAIAVS